MLVGDTVYQIKNSTKIELTTLFCSYCCFFRWLRGKKIYFNLFSSKSRDYSRKNWNLHLIAISSFKLKSFFCFQSTQKAINLFSNFQSKFWINRLNFSKIIIAIFGPMTVIKLAKKVFHLLPLSRRYSKHFFHSYQFWCTLSY